MTQLKRASGRRGDGWAIALLLVVVALVWVPRMRGGIDLRWDAAVYYSTGTALAEGQGYRLINEPVDAQAVQYPPLLPVVAGAVQWLCGSTDPAVTGWWLRVLYAGIYAGYVLATYALSRWFFRPMPATALTLVAALHYQTIFLSDLLFAEIPFALCVVGLILLNRRQWAGATAGQTVLAWGAFLLRSAGIALLAAWVADALCRRQWKLAAARALLAAVPVVAWQGYVAWVTHSPAYVHPAYEYQRADYQYYNVPYADNLKLIDPFAPERGKITPIQLARRVVGNVPALVQGWGESVLSSRNSIDQIANTALKRLGLHPRVVEKITFGVTIALGLAVLGGIILLLVRREWLIGLYILAAAGTVVVTPWPSQFGRYLAPMIPLLLIALALAVGWIASRVMRLAAQRSELSSAERERSPAGMAWVTAVLAVLIVAEGAGVFRMYRPLVAAVRGRTPGAGEMGRLFYFNDGWAMYESAADWLRVNAPKDAIIASGAPQWVYLKTGHKSVMTPMVIDPAEAQRLLDGVPVTYAIDDQVDIGSITSRYLRPILQRDGQRWQVVYVAPDGKTRVMQRQASIPGQ
jgi:hypothetical protein